MSQVILQRIGGHIEFELKEKKSYGLIIRFALKMQVPEKFSDNNPKLVSDGDDLSETNRSHTRAKQSNLLLGGEDN